MTDIYLYGFAALVLAIVGAAWYFTKGSIYNREVTKYGMYIVLFVVLVMVSRKSPLFSGVVRWFRNLSDDKKIKKLDQEIKEFEKRKKDGLIKVGEIGKEAKILKQKADLIRKEVEEIDADIAKQLKDLDNPIESKLPKPIKDPVKEAKNLLKALQERRASGQL